MEQLNNNLKIIWDKIDEINTSKDDKILSEEIARVFIDAGLREQIDNLQIQIDNLNNTENMNNQLTTTIVAGENLPANRFVNFNGFLCNSGDKVLGVTTELCKVGEVATLVSHGVVSVETNGMINVIGSEVRSSADGKVQIATGTFQNIHTLDYSSGAGQFIRVKI